MAVNHINHSWFTKLWLKANSNI